MSLTFRQLCVICSLVFLIGLALADWEAMAACQSTLSFDVCHAALY